MSKNLRRHRRHSINEAIAVTDLMTDEIIGRIGNLSESGMLLLASVPLVDDALYQLQFVLHDAQLHAHKIELGAQVLWQDGNAQSWMGWVGLRFFAIPSGQQQTLKQWLADS